MGVVYKNWFRSNTAGVTWGKYFKEVADRVRFSIKNKEEISKINSIKSFEEGVNILENNLRKDLLFKFDYSFYEGIDEYIDCSLRMINEKEDYIVLPHKLEKLAFFNELVDFTFGKDVTNIVFFFKIDKKYIEEIKLIYTERKHLPNDVLIEKLTKLPITSSRWRFSIGERTYFDGNRI